MYGHETYKTNDIETASKMKLVVMLYQGAIRFAYISIEAIEQKNYEIANLNTIKSQNIVSELLASLNFEAGNIASELSSLYIYIHRLLVEGNMQKNTTLIQEAIELLSNLKEGWDELLAAESSESTITTINISG